MSSADQSQVVTFRLGEELFAADIFAVERVLRYEAPTPVPNLPAWIEGVIDYQGRVVPVLDLRIKFNLGEARYDSFTVMIILNLAGRVVGAVVDSVSDVVHLAAEQIRPAPPLGAGVDARYLVGVGVVEKRMILLIDIERLLGAEDLALIDRAAG